jgi:biotin synthase-related radical SAM superfamily protein
VLIMKENEVEKTLVEKKALLLLGGKVRIPSNMELPYRPSCSTAGPGAGSTGIVLAFGGMRVKKAVSREDGEFELVPQNNIYSLWHKGRMFIEEVEIRPVVFHAPGQAFFNLDNRCIFGCSFCSSPLLDETLEKGHTPDKVVEMIVASYAEEGFDAVAITSGVPDTVEKTLDRILSVVRQVRKAHPSISIGVEPYISSLDQIDLLKDAGADEIKINIETYDRKIFSRVCPKKDYDLLLRSIEHAGVVFGQGKVASNIIIGLGETDENVLQGVEHLASLGCVATLRSLRTNAFNRNALSREIEEGRPVNEERLMRLVRAQMGILKEHDLTTLEFRTMCHRCGCCDIVPFVDVK